MSSKTNSKALPLGDTLRDLAILRASDLDLSSAVPDSESSFLNPKENADAIEASVAQSYGFVKEARKVIKMNNGGDVDDQGTKIETERGKVEDVIKAIRAPVP